MQVKKIIINLSERYQRQLVCQNKQLGSFYKAGAHIKTRKWQISWQTEQHKSCGKSENNLHDEEKAQKQTRRKYSSGIKLPEVNLETVEYLSVLSTFPFSTLRCFQSHAASIVSNVNRPAVARRKRAAATLLNVHSYLALLSRVDGASISTYHHALSCDHCEYRKHTKRDDTWANMTCNL